MEKHQQLISNLDSEDLKLWECKIGGTTKPLPKMSDVPMRKAVQQAYFELTGEYCDIIFTGWGSKLTESEKEVMKEVYQENKDRL